MRSGDSSQWRRFGEVDPYFGVLSSEGYKRENLTEETLERFFASGEAYVEWLFEQLGDLRPRTTLDFGCGVGRVLVPLAQRSGEVTGVDVSPAMLAECRNVCEKRGIRNVRLNEHLPDGQFDLVHSTLVLQHVHGSQGYRLLGELAGRVTAGGVGALHVPLRPSTARARVFFWGTAQIPYAPNLWNLVRGRAWSYPHMLMTAYRLDRVLELLASHGIFEVRTIFQPATTPMEFHSATILFAGAG